jgi:hypothetical protein
MSKRRLIFFCGLLLCSLSGITAQITVVNEGILTIKEGQLVHINGSFSNYAALFLNNGDFRLTGDFLNEASVANPGTGIFRFIGINEQQLTLYDTLRMYHVDMDNPSGIRFNGFSNLHVFGNFNFYDGIAYTNSEAMIFFRNNASTSGASDFSHIDGPALKLGSEDFVFPLGNQGFYRPAAISELTSAGLFRMEYFHETYFNEIKAIEVLQVNPEGYWDFKNINNTAFPKLTLHYDETSNLFTGADYVQIVHWKDPWSIVPSQSDGASPSMGIITQEPLAAPGFYTTAERKKYNPNIISTTVSQDEDCKIRIDWVMSPGSVVQSYEVEYSYDSLNFFYLGEVTGSLTPLANFTSYTLVDTILYETEDIYYRIKMIPTGIPDTFTYTEVMVLENKCVFKDFVLFPNPVAGDQNIKLKMTSSVDTQLPIMIWDELGRLMLEQTLDVKVGNHIYEINTKEMGLASATYFLQLTLQRSLKFVVINR